jgi:hypothetical protein
MSCSFKHSKKNYEVFDKNTNRTFFEKGYKAFSFYMFLVEQGYKSAKKTDSKKGNLRKICKKKRKNLIFTPLNFAASYSC